MNCYAKDCPGCLIKMTDETCEAVDCPHYKPRSNADMIRNMADEELAYLLVHNPWMREETALDWLRQEADT